MLNDDQILRLLRQDIDAAEEVSEVEAVENAHTYKYYRAKNIPEQPAVKGKSQFVSTDVMEVVEWLSPQLADIFSEQNGVPTLIPHGLEDRNASELMEELIRYQFFRQNEGEDLLLDVVQDALMYRPGAIIKWHWEKSAHTNNFKLTDVTEEELLLLARDAKISIAGYELKDTGYDVDVNREEIDYDGPRFELVPPWEFLRHPNYKKVSDSPFIAHRKRVTLDYLRKQQKEGFYKNIDRLVATNADSYGDDVTEQTMYGQDNLERRQEPVQDDPRKEIVIYECYVKIDADGDGLLEDRIITVADNVIIRNEENVYQRPPFSVIRCIKDTHKFSGIPVAEFAKDIQRLNTSIIRQTADNIAQSNNARKVINPEAVYMADVMDNRPGVPIRVKSGTDVRAALSELGVQPVNNSVVNFMGVVKEIGEQRTGVSKIFKTVGDPHNQTASGQYAALNQANSRIRKMAKIMAEGLKDVFRGMILMNKKFMTDEQVVRITNERFIELKPDDLEGRYDIDVNVLIGANSKQQQVNNMMQLLSIGAQMQPLMPILDGDNLSEMWKEIVKNLGYKDIDRFLPAALKQQKQTQQNPQLTSEMNPALQSPNISSINKLSQGESAATMPSSQGGMPQLPQIIE